MITILFQGDSITDGNRLKDPASRWDLNHQIGHSYVFNIVGTLGRRYPGKFRFVNRGLSGDHVKSIEARWQADTLDEHPDILSLLLGINGNRFPDNRQLYEGTPEEIEENLREFDEGYRRLLDSVLAQKPGTKLILIEPFSLPVGAYKVHYEGLLPIFPKKQEMVRRIAEDYGAVWIPVQKTLNRLVDETAAVFARDMIDLDPMAYWLWDGVHPTEPMHCVIADLWLAGAGDPLNGLLSGQLNSD